ncbi:Rap30/74 interaction domain-containing protein [Ramaria rubella]|nr:Rap30/74 interaction domain-containing protein [Ramaria rubella]
MASMFHKPIKKELSAAVERKPRPRPPRPRPAAKPEPDVDEDNKPPTGNFTDYQVISSSRRGWKYDIMKFESRGKEIDPTKWDGPVKLNRKDYRPPETDGADDGVIPVELTPMLGPDGKPVIGVDGKLVMVGPDGKVPQANGANGGKNGKDALKGKGKGKQMFKKKTKQVYVVPEETRQLRREERYPWVMEENGANGQVWVGHIENPEKSLTHGLLVPMGSQFQFVPSHRWYKFQKRPTYRILALEEAEAEYAKTQKNKDPERWLMRKKAAGGKGPSDATLATLKAEAEGRSGSTGPSGLRAVDSGDADLFGGDDDDEEEKMNKKRRDKELGGEGDIDEVEFEADFADDEEKIEMDGDDEEAKESEERMKREYRTANKLRDAHIDEDEEEEDIQLTGAGKDLKKIVRKTEKNDGYDDSDDDDKDPFISDDEEPEENPPPQTPDGPAVQNQSQPPSQPASGTSTPTPRPATGPQTPRPQKPTVKNKPLQQPRATPSSRANSPGLGNAVVAKRATSPKAPKQKVIVGAGGGGSRAGSPLASGSRAPSPVPGSGSPSRSAAAASGSRANSPTPPTGSLKRKATDDAPTPPGVAATLATADGAKPRKKAKRPLEESMVIEFLREKKEASTKEAIQKFQPYLKDPEVKAAFTAMVKKVAVVKNGMLSLRSNYQQPAAADST